MSTCCRSARISRSLSSTINRLISAERGDNSRRRVCQNMIGGSSGD